MLHSLFISACAVIVALFPVTSASASPKVDPLAQWVAQVNQQLDMHLRMPISDATGLARVSFRRGADGRATDIAVRSGNGAVAKAGVQTIKRLRNLPPLPVGMPADQRIVMNVLIGSPGTTEPYNVQRARLLADGAAHNATLASALIGPQVALATDR